MKKIFYNVTISIILFTTIIFINSCADDSTVSLEEYPSANLPAPVLSTINPSSQALAGVTVITITGENFSSNIRNNRVYFNGEPGTILNSTTTELVVKVPNVVDDTVIVKIAVVGSQNFSNIFQYKMVPAWEVYYPLDKDAEKAYGIILDNSNNLLISLLGKGVWKITPLPDTSKTLFIPVGNNAQKWDNFRFGPGGELYGVRSARGVWKLEENVAPAGFWAAPSAGIIGALEFDANQNLWTLNSSNSIFRFKQDKTIATFPFTGVLRAIRIFNNELYVAATKDGIEGVWKIPIDANGDLGTAELYFDISNIRLQTKINAIAFAEDGNLILGLDKGPDPILVVKPDKSYEELYPGVIEANSVISIFWPSNSTSMYFVRGEERNADGTKVVVGQAPLRVEMEKYGAPYYGQ